jgi:hypothetical protein
MTCRSISGKSILASMQFFPNYLITMTAHIALEHLKIETKLINERFTSEMGECVILTPIFKIIRSVTTLVRIFPHLDFSWEENTEFR